MPQGNFSGTKSYPRGGGMKKLIFKIGREQKCGVCYFVHGEGDFPPPAEHFDALEGHF